MDGPAVLGARFFAAELDRYVAAWCSAKMVKPHSSSELRILAGKARRLGIMSHDAVIGAALLATAKEYEREANLLERDAPSQH